MRPLKLTTPTVTECASPKGLPMTTTQSATSTREAEDSLSTGSFRPASIFNSAKSVRVVLAHHLGGVLLGVAALGEHGDGDAPRRPR